MPLRMPWRLAPRHRMPGLLMTGRMDDQDGWIHYATIRHFKYLPDVVVWPENDPKEGESE